MKIENFKQKALSVGLALAIAAGTYVVSAPTTAYASKSDIHPIVNEYTEEEELWYTVQKNDNASRISSYLVSYFIAKGEVPDEDRAYFKENENRRCSYWPGVIFKYLNDENEKREAEALAAGKKSYTKKTKFNIHPGDTFKVPSSYAELKEWNKAAKVSGWYANYCKQNNIYAKKNTIYLDMDEAKERIQEVYRYLDPSHNHEITDAEVYAYLKGIGGPNLEFKIKEGATLNPKKDEVWQFYEYLMTPEETKQIMEKDSTQKQKTKKR